MNNTQIETAFKVTDSQYYSTGCRTYQTQKELELQSGDSMSTLNTTVKNCGGK